jgi:hypothetical protein
MFRGDGRGTMAAILATALMSVVAADFDFGVAANPGATSTQMVEGSIAAFSGESENFSGESEKFVPR